MRKLRRSVAQFRMSKSQYVKFNKPGADGRSFFAKHWREACGLDK